jgi:dihydroorotate dehydrogenase (fumarate)
LKKGVPPVNVDLSTWYLGLHLKNPLVVAACPLTRRLESLRRLEEAGASAVVLPSLFEEQVAHEILTFHRMHSFGTVGAPQPRAYSPDMDQYNTGHDSYLELIADAKKSLSIPVIASLNGASKGGWVCCAEMIEQAGADALELNIYHIPTDPDETGLQVETRLLEVVAAVREVIQIPLAVKLGSHFSSIPNMAKRLAAAGADGLVMFNRFLQPGISLETLDLMPHMTLSRPEEIGHSLRWIAILRPRLQISLAASGGVHEAADVLKLMLVGANAVTTASALLLHGTGHLTAMLDEVRTWMDRKGLLSLSELKLRADPAATTDLALLERIQYIKTIVSTVASDD